MRAVQPLMRTASPTAAPPTAAPGRCPEELTSLVAPRMKRPRAPSLRSRYLDNEANLARRAYAWLEYRKLLRWEAPAYARVNGIMATSEHDAIIIRRLCPALPVTVVPNAVDISTNVVETDPGSRVILFVGAMDRLPNLDGVLFFVRDILPAIKARSPEAEFVIAGRLPPPPLSHYAIASNARARAFWDGCQTSTLLSLARPFPSFRCGSGAAPESRSWKPRRSDSASCRPP
jgi:glycosyltransferase involved in cell wall biosynthesis